MAEAQALARDMLYTACNPNDFSFQTTAELQDIDVIVGQERALDALRFGLRMRGDGYNIFALGPSGVGKLTAARQMVEAEAQHRPPPPDWCYVYDFAHPDKPNAIKLPPGQGARLRDDMVQLVEDLRVAIPAAFESDDYRARIEELEQALEDRRRERMDKLGEEARSQRIALMHTPTGFAFAPMGDDSDAVLKPEEYQKLPEAERRRIKTDVEGLQESLQKILRQLPQWAKETREQTKEVNREIAELAVSHLIEVLQGRYATIKELTEYLDAAKTDIIENVDAFLPSQESPFAPTQQGDALRRYEINLLVDNGELDRAPVVFEDLPSYTNLIGRTEYQAHMGTLTTDFTLIKPGALHRANGGYLVLDARQVLLQPFAWDGLKRALQSREIRLDSLERSLSLVSTVSLEPEHVPLELKLILVGDRRLYYLLSEYDPDFADLFKVMADFDEIMERGPEANQLYAELFATLARQHSLRHLQPAAVARLIEQGARMAEDAEKSSTHLRALADLLREADHWAAEANHPVIGGVHVQRAIDQLTYRAERVRQRMYENIRRGTLLIDTTGGEVGQINGLSVLQLGHFRFGQPTRITATTRLGGGKVIDIERETELGGPIHSKGVLILSSLLASRYAGHLPLSMSASLVFEQSYGMVEGDSASLAELCALLSSLAQLPIKASLAVTGSVNQHGRVQPIGGVNEKIEGFFDVCSERGLKGDQGVIIPQSNIKHLMLRADVVQAVGEGRFAVYAVATVDQAISLLTATDAGDRDADGKFPADSVNGRVEARLVELSELRRRFAKGGTDENGGNDHG